MRVNSRVQQRMNDLDDLLELYYEKLKAFQNELAITANIETKFAVKKRINLEILPYIKEYETEYAKLLTDIVSEVDMSEEEVEDVVSEIQEAITIVRAKAEEKQETSLIQSTEKVQKTLEKSDISTKGKLKATIPLIPGIISYQLELDAYSTLSSVWEKLKSKLKKRK